MLKKYILSVILALFYCTLANAQTPPYAIPQLRLDSTSGNNLLQFRDRGNQWVTFGTSNPTTHAFGPSFTGGTFLTVPQGGTGVATFTTNAPLLGNGVSALTQGSRSGNTTVFGTTNGLLVNGDCAQFDANGNLVDAGAPCGTGGGGGSVTSVNITVPSFLTVSGVPITSTGTAAIGLATETANTVFSGPATGSPATPTFRALVNADLPAIPTTDLTGQVSVPNGGTGVGTFTANAPLIGNGTSALTQGTRSGNTTVFGTTNGTLTSGHCVQFDSSGNLVDAGGVCTTGGGGGTVTSAALNDLAVYTTNPTGTVVGGLATANNGVLVTNGTGVPSIGSTLPSAVQANITGTGVLASGSTATGFNVACASMPSLTGDVTSTACADTIAANAVTYAKFQQVAANSLIGNPTVSLANSQGITLGTTLTFSGTSLQTKALTGDITAAANSFATTLATVNSNVGSFGSGTAIPTFTVNAKGLITAAGTATPSIATTQLTGTLQAAQFPALTGDVTTVAGSLATTLATVNSNTGSFGSSSLIPIITANGKGLITAISTATPSVVIGASVSGTCTSGQVLYDNAGLVGCLSASTGTVTSVGLSMPSIFTVTNSPVTSSGTLTTSLANQNANLVFAGPASGLAATPTFRALVNADLPAIPTTDLTGTLQAAQEPAHTGDVTNSSGSLALALATVNSNVGTFGSATNVSSVTVNAKGLITAISNIPINIPFSAVTGTLQGSQFPALTGDVTTVAGSLTTTLASVNTSGAGTYGNASANPVITVDAKGRITAITTSSWSGGSAPANSGTCAINTQLGNNTAGSFKANGACSGGTIILTFSNSSTNGWACSATDLTNGGVTLRQTAYTISTVTFIATMTNLDLVTYQCTPF